MIMLNVPGTRLNLQNQMAAQQAIAMRNIGYHNARAAMQPWRDLTALQNAYGSHQRVNALAMRAKSLPSYKTRSEAVLRRLAATKTFKEWQAVMGELSALDKAQVDAELAEMEAKR